jgi:hypothetical protein
MFASKGTEAAVSIYINHITSHLYTFIGDKWAMSSYVVHFLRLSCTFTASNATPLPITVCLLQQKGVQEGEIVVS